jgi:hypothetical protein
MKERQVDWDATDEVTTPKHPRGRRQVDWDAAEVTTNHPNHPSYATNTGCTAQLVHDSIDESLANDQIAHLPHSPEAETELAGECEGHDDNGLFWGVDCDGGRWSVQLD